MAVLGSASLVGLSLATEHATRKPLEQAGNAAANSFTSQARTAALSDLVNALGMRAAMVRRHLDERASVMNLQSQGGSFAAGGYMSYATRFIRLALQSLRARRGRLAGGRTTDFRRLRHLLRRVAVDDFARAFSPLEMVLGSWRSLTEAHSAFSRLNTTLAQGLDQSAKPRSLPPPTGHLMVETAAVGRGLEPLTVPILSGVAFSVRPGEILGLVGPSGAENDAATSARWSERASRICGVVRLDHANALPDWDAGPPGKAHRLPATGTSGCCRARLIKQNICRFGDVLGRSREEIDAKAVAAAQICGAHEMILPGCRRDTTASLTGAVAGSRSVRLSESRWRAPCSTIPSW